MVVRKAEMNLGSAGWTSPRHNSSNSLLWRTGWAFGPHALAHAAWLLLAWLLR